MRMDQGLINKMTPEGGAAGVSLGWTRVSGGRGDASSLFVKNRIDLRHYNEHSRLSPSLAMQQTGQWCCLIQVNDFFAVSSSRLDVRWRGFL
jgi:hypothetical protein